jgi:uncharacterized protein YlzI (FlbEa/FlbD family)
MIKLIQLLTMNAHNERVVWLNAAHVIAVEDDDGQTCITVTGPSTLYVAESVERVVELVTAAK